MKLDQCALIRLIASGLIALLAGACSGGDDEGGSSSTATSLGSTSATGASSAERAFTVAEMTELAGSKVEGYVAEEPLAGTATSNIMVSYEPAEGGSELSVIVTLAPCDPFICWDLDGAITAEHEQNLKSNLPRVHIDNPDLVFEYGTIELAPGYEGFFTYSRSFVQDDSSTATSNGYRSVYHDGANLISILVTPVFGPLPDSAEELEMELDQSKGEVTARKFFAAYAEAFEPAQ